MNARNGFRMENLESGVIGDRKVCQWRETGTPEICIERELHSTIITFGILDIPVKMDMRKYVKIEKLKNLIRNA